MVISWRLVTIFDSSKVTDSPIWNLFCVKYTISISVAEDWVANCATAPLSAPLTLSPKIDDVLRLNPETKVNLSKTGADVSKDSYTATTSTTSGTFKDISSSSILRP